ncbi:MAG: TerB family tellurite resistance protein [Parvibaculum sp.]|jgi:uncharacterized tellurite resistance protein B-like protein|uniref:tellurite resistance TerB family protein n=1 Tax=Parvibaculum sp. TaxID=2024848 RepID=UPI002846CA4E|nr:TerB family tellurite resistance protein [Parvibaculum sp.]MDR3497662.1 TerB family tellurite resistance protein [Parvibaculum sp.]
MLDRIKAFLTGETEDAQGGFDQVQVAVVALLIRAAAADAHFDDVERAAISQIAQRHFELTTDEVERLIEVAARDEAETMDLFRWTQAIKQRYDEAERIGLIEKLWEVVYADGVLDDFEANLLRRVAGLIYVPDRESGQARQRVLARLGLKPSGA